MIGRGLLRALAVAIAVAGVIDPAVTWRVPVPGPLTIVVMRDDLLAAAARLQALWDDEYAVRIELHDRASRAAACPSSGGCIIVSDGPVPTRLTAGATVIGGLRVAGQAEAAAIANVRAPHRVALDAASALTVHLQHPVGRLEVFDGDVLVGQIAPDQRTSVALPWMPIDAGARKLRVMSDAQVVDVGVIVDARPVPVFMYEPEATWLGTFVRRALADHRSIVLSGRTRVAPPVTVTRGEGGNLDESSLAGVGVVVVAAPHALGTAEVTLLERFVADRGGSVVLLPDRRPTGPVLRLLPPIAAERRVPAAQTLGPLAARELLLFEDDEATEILDGIDVPVLVEHVIGRGRVVVSGAMDAWRYRGGEGAFEAFWSALIVDAAHAAGPPLRVTVTPPVTQPGGEVAVDVAYHSLGALPDEIVASGALQCADGARHVRLWPGARAGTFHGTFTAEQEGECRFSATVADRTEQTSLLITTDVRRIRRNHLEPVVAAYGGVVVTRGEEDALTARLRRELTLRHEQAAIHPMRSSLWIMPFVLCLGAEWFLRRRSGLR